MIQPVSIIIPVYNAFEATLECIESVIANTPPEVRVFVIDDCSPEGDLLSWLSSRIKLPSNILVSRNQKNLGFVGTCNSGMLIKSYPDDVVLLNSDTVVTAKWLEKLQEAALSSPKIGTVTPLTNNGTICSVPNFLEDNKLPFDFTIEQMANLVESVSAKERPTLPTCVGFCVYIRRALLDRVGGFDPVFGKGYGEENDLSLRGQKAGFIDIIDDATFILHKGSMSFVGDKELLSKTNTKILSKRYVDYFAKVSAFCSLNPLHRIQGRILNPLLERYEESKEFRVLHILHNGPYKKRRHNLGGTELHVQDLISNIDNVAHWTLVKAPDAYYLSCHTSDFDREFRFGVDSPVIADLLKSKFFPLIHVHHTVGFERSDLVKILENHPGLIVSVHDYYSLCPRIFMWTATNEVCSGTECSKLCGFTSDEIEDFRASSKKLLEQAKKIIVFSDSSKKIMSSIFGKELSYCEIPHGSGSSKRFSLGSKTIANRNIPLKVAFVTSLVQHKGSELILEVSNFKQLPCGKPVSWCLFGTSADSQPPLDSHLEFAGSYKRGSLASKLKEKEIDLVVLPSQCNETFSYTLGEAWGAGLPVIVTPYGALKERVEATDGGWVLSSSKAKELIDLLDNICIETASYDNKLANVEKLSLLSVQEEAQSYYKLYTTLKSDIVSDEVSVAAFLQPDLSSAPVNVVPIPSMSLRIRTFIVEASRI